MKDFLKKNWIQVLTLALCAFLALQVTDQAQRLERMESRLDQQIHNLQISVDNSVSRLAEQVTQGIREADQPIETFDLVPTGVDMEGRALLAEVSVTLRRWSAESQPVLLVTAGEETREYPLTAATGGVFTAPVSLSLEDGARALTLAATVEQDGVFTRQELGSWEDVYYLLPCQANGWGNSALDGYQDGVLTLTPDAAIEVEDRDYENRQVNDPRVQVYRNGALVWEEPAHLDPNLIQDGYYTYYLGDTAHIAGAQAVPPAPIEIPCGDGDEVTVVFTCTDDYGLGYTFLHSRCTIMENGLVEEAAPRMAADYPQLTWPQ